MLLFRRIVVLQLMIVLIIDYHQTGVKCDLFQKKDDGFFGSLKNFGSSLGASIANLWPFKSEPKKGKFCSNNKIHEKILF